MARAPQGFTRKLNLAFKRQTGITSLHGVKLVDRMRVVIEGAGHRVPDTKARMKKLAASILAGQKIEGGGVTPSAPKPAPKVTAPRFSDAFYASWEWKRVRYEAIKLHGRRCQCCGWEPGQSAGHLVVDHIKPRRRYPELELDLSNLQVLCNDCNMGKGAAYEDDFRTFEERHRATIQ